MVSNLPGQKGRYGAIKKTVQEVEESVIGSYGDSEFLKKIEGRKAGEIWEQINELMDALQALNPKLYKSFMDKI